MSEAVFIKRRERRRQEDGFDTLRREAIQTVQQLSGTRWTDYNLHDPGVTILEQLIYAITDIIYRADFPVADFLVDETGEIDFERQSLHLPERIYSCRPATLLDYRKTILNAVSELDNVWLIPVASRQSQDGLCRGLYKIALKPQQGLDATQLGILQEKVRRVFLHHRNLCEDVAAISVVTGVEYELCAEVEVGSARRPVDILAEIYFQCARRIAGGIGQYGYEQAVDGAHDLDQLFDGPFTDHGMFKDDEFGGNRSEFPVATLYSLINSLEEVDHVRELYLEREGRRYYDVITSEGPETSFNLVVPINDERVRIVLTTNGRVLPVPMDEVRAKYDELNFRYHSGRAKVRSLSQLYHLPEGRSRPLSDYVSIQQQFPGAYGIGRFGVPESEAPAVKARAKQLRSYLLLFEQLIANSVANLGSIRTLFSGEKQGASYAVATLSELQIDGLDAIYPASSKEVLKSIVAKYDDFRERKSRLLDYLLAMYGESFTQHSLRHFNYYYSPTEVEQLIVDNKTEFLSAIVELGRDRAAAGFYCGDSWSVRAGSGLQRRVSILLGFVDHTPRPLSMALLDQGIKLTHHRVYEKLKADSAELEFIDADELEQAGFETAPALAWYESLSVHEVRSRIEDTIPLNNNLLSDALLRGGIYLDRLRIGSMSGGQDYQLIFQTDEGRYWYLGTYPDHEAAIRAANAMRRFLIHLNTRSEGLHVIEHLLLRPIGTGKHPGVSLPKGEDFYSFRVSVIFPAWTARCYNPQFRLLAEETVRLNAPSHVYPEFYWLDFHKMYEFEMLYEKWMALKSNRAGVPEEINQASMAMVSFLLENSQSRGGGVR